MLGDQSRIPSAEQISKISEIGRSEGNLGEVNQIEPIKQIDESGNTVNITSLETQMNTKDARTL